MFTLTLGCAIITMTITLAHVAHVAIDILQTKDN